MIFLCADSSPFFHPRLAQSVNKTIARELKSRNITKAVYFGGANGYLPEYAELAAGIAEGVGVKACLCVGETQPGKDAHKLQLVLPRLNEPALIILAGGSVTEGWKILSDPSVRDWLENQLRIGAVFIGVSAGAIHLAAGLDDNGDPLQCLNWVSVNIAVHEELLGWPSVKKLVQNEQDVLEIPMGEVVAYSTGQGCQQHGPQRFYSLAGRAVLNKSGHNLAPDLAPVPSSIPASGFA